MSRPRDPDAPDALDALDRLAALPPPTPPPLSPALEAELAGLTPSAPRRPLRQLALLVAGSLGYAALLLYATTTRDDLGDLPTGWLVGAALGWLGGFVVPTYCALVPRRGAVTPRWLLAALPGVIWYFWMTAAAAPN